MSGQHYCLRWNNYQSNMTSVFHQLLQTEAFVDVTLSCNDSSLKAHKVFSHSNPHCLQLGENLDASVLGRSFGVLVLFSKTAYAESVQSPHDYHAP